MYMSITTASPNCTTRYMAPPAEDHPLFPLFRQHNVLRELEIEADLACERLAATPMTLAEDHPADTLTGEPRERYLRWRQKRDDYSHAAYMLDISIQTVVDNLGGM